MSWRRLTNELLAWVLGSLVLLWLSFIFMAYRTGEHEADELTDGHLAATAALLVNLEKGKFRERSLDILPGGQHELKAHDYQQSLTVAIWDADGRLVTRSGEGPTPAFRSEEGFATMPASGTGTPWRMFSRWDRGREHKVTVLLALGERDALAKDIAAQVIEPGLWLLPLLALVLGVAIRRGLRPLYKLSDEVHALDIRRPRPLPTSGRHQEFRASVDAINALVERYQASLLRERELADEFAHELRTPLTSLALQAQALRSTPEGPGRELAIRQLEADVLRTGEVISHLLALARASRTELADALQPLDLEELARTTVAELAPAASRTGHQLALESAGPWTIRGHAALLELALRNLLDNGVRHTRRGSTVEVQLDREAGFLQVCDRADAEVPVTGVPLAPRLAGTGLGHRVVRKVAEIHQATFEQVIPPPAGYASCYRVSFSQPRDRRPET